jgi:hypothetical protein
MVAGAAVGILGRLVDVHWIEFTLAAAAVVLLLGGAMLVANTYREESGRSSGGSRASLISHQLMSSARASRMARSSSKADPVALAAATAAIDESELRLYALEFERSLDHCADLLAAGSEASAHAEALATARDELMVLVANARYGTALERGLVDEVRVRELSTRLAKKLA